MKNKTNRSNGGTIISVRGGVVDVHFDQCLPPIYTVLRAGAHAQIVIEVMTQLDAHRVRGIALTPTQGLARGMPVEDTGAPLQAPVGRQWERMQSLAAGDAPPAPRLLPVPNSVEAIAPLVGQILIDIEAAREQGDVVEIYLFHNRPKAAAAY